MVGCGLAKGLACCFEAGTGCVGTANGSAAGAAGADEADTLRLSKRPATSASTDVGAACCGGGAPAGGEAANPNRSTGGAGGAEGPVPGILATLIIYQKSVRKERRA